MLTISDKEREARYTWDSPDQLQVVEKGDGEAIDLVAMFGDDDEAATDSAALPGGSVEAMRRYHQVPVVVETKQGALRYGLFWKTRMPADYGYIGGVQGADGDELDCYIGEHPESDRVYVADQNNFDGTTFDEHKVIFGCETLEEAHELYMRGHHKSKIVFRGITEMSMDEFKQWVDSADLTKPCGSQ